MALSAAQVARNKLAAIIRRGDDPAAIKRARDELAVANEETAQERAESRIAEAIRKEIAKAPPLTDEQRERLALLLGPAKAALAVRPNRNPAESGDGE